MLVYIKLFKNNILFCSIVAASYSFPHPVFIRFENFFTYFTVGANPELSDVTWTRDGVILSNENNIVITITSITITNLWGSDNGTYTLTSDNGVGEGSGSFVFFLMSNRECNYKASLLILL